jgi:WhiB family redox-sensing transcriptional regulator
MNEDWRDRAACADIKYAGKVDDVFFPSGTTEQTEKEIAIAKKICLTCDVIEICESWSIKHNIDAGIWGGLSEEERRNIRRRLRQEKQGSRV